MCVCVCVRARVRACVRVSVVQWMVLLVDSVCYYSSLWSHGPPILQDYSGSGILPSGLISQVIHHRGWYYKAWTTIQWNLASKDTSISQRKCPCMTGVPVGRVSLYDGCPCMTGVPVWRVSLYDGCPCMTGVPVWRVSLYDGCPCMTGVPVWRVSLYDGCPCMTGVPVWRVSLYDGCPCMTGVPVWQVSLHRRSLNMRKRKRPVITGCPLISVSLEDRLRCVTVLLRKPPHIIVSPHQSVPSSDGSLQTSFSVVVYTCFHAVLQGIVYACLCMSILLTAAVYMCAHATLREASGPFYWPSLYSRALRNIFLSSVKMFFSKLRGRLKYVSLTISFKSKICT